MSGPPFRYVRAADVGDALRHARVEGSVILAGGTDLLQLWKAGVMAPRCIIDISHLPLASVTYTGGTLELGALARLSNIAGHADVKARHPLIASAISASASGQIRNMATVAGNLLQRTRCPYFRGAGFACNKRVPGSGCGARDGENRHAALFGWTNACMATHASDLTVALTALNADVIVQSAGGDRSVAIADLYPLPDATQAPDSLISAGDLITKVRVPGAQRLARRSTFLKVRDRASFEFAVLSVAAAMRLEDGHIADARLAVGGVAARPWRLAHSEASLIGKAPDSEAFAAAADLAIKGARPLAHNAFKVNLMRNAVVRALQDIGAGHE